MKRRLEGLPRLTRGWRIVRNLILAALAAVVVWGALGFPISNPELSFHRAERANLVGPAQIQGTLETEWARWTVGTCRDQVLLHRDDRLEFEYWPRQAQGATLCPVPWDRGAMEGELWIVAVDPPEGARRAVLSLTTACYYVEYDYGPEEGYEGVGRQYSAIEDPPGGWKYWPVKRWEKDYQAEGRRLEGGAFLFHIPPENEEKPSAEAWFLSNAREWSLYTTARERREMDCRMEAVFYDSSGREVGRAGLETPE